MTVRDGVLRQNGYQRGRETEGVAQAAAAVTALLAPHHRTATRAVLCLTAQDQDLQSIPGVDVVGRWKLPEHLIALPARLSVFEVADIANHLREQLDKAAEPKGSRRPTKKAQPARPTSARRPARPTLQRKLASLALTLLAIVVGYLVVTDLLQSLSAAQLGR